MKKRKFEYFEVEKKENYKTYSNVPPQLMRQERDWTCSVAAVRTILSGIYRGLPDEVHPEKIWVISYNLCKCNGV